MGIRSTKKHVYLRSIVIRFGSIPPLWARRGRIRSCWFRQRGMPGLCDSLSTMIFASYGMVGVLATMDRMLKCLRYLSTTSLGHGKLRTRLLKSLLTSSSFTIPHNVSSERQAGSICCRSGFDVPSLYLETFLAQGERILSQIRTSCTTCKDVAIGKQERFRIALHLWNAMTSDRRKLPDLLPELLLSDITLPSPTSSIFIC